MQKKKRVFRVALCMFAVAISMVFIWNSYVKRNFPNQDSTVIKIRKETPWGSSSDNFVMTVFDNGDVLLFEPDPTREQSEGERVGRLKKAEIDYVISMFMDLEDLKTQPVAFDSVNIQITYLIDGQRATIAYMLDDPVIPEWLRSPEKVITDVMTLP